MSVSLSPARRLTAFSCLPFLNHRLSNSNNSARELSRHRDQESLAFRHSRTLFCDEFSERGRELVDSHNSNPVQALEMNRESLQVTAIAFLVLFCIVGMALRGLPFYYDFMVQQFGWTRAQVTSGNALSKLVVGPVFGFIAGWVVDRFGPRRLMSCHSYIVCEALASGHVRVRRDVREWARR
jgi:hypothetical protein